MQISITRPDLEQFVADKVKRGEFTTADAVVENALETVKVQHEALPSGAELRRLIAEGQAEADRGELIPARQVFQALLQHSAKRRAGQA